MIKIKFIFFIFIAYIAITLNQQALAWNEVTHMTFSQFAAKYSILEVTNGNYMIKLGYQYGLNEKILWKNNIQEIIKWILDGALLEDAGSDWDAIRGSARFNNHFHNPLKPWDSAGLSDLQNGESSVIWAQNSNNQVSSIGGDWSWKKIRDNFYYALTSKTDAERQSYFAQTFRGLGHQMHLIQDAAQPAHVRNDAHPIDGKGWTNGLETWTKNNLQHIDAMINYAPDPFFPQVALDIKVSSYFPITQFIDTRKYIGNLTRDTSLGQGLSEYTNSNFVSDDTIFTHNFSKSDKHYFPYPAYSTSCYELYEENTSYNKKTKYIRKKCDGELIDHFSVVGPFFKYLDFSWDLQRLTLKLDSKVHSDYARKLIPRAVGYSAGLLNYFFRGDVFMISDDNLGYGYVIVNNTDEDISGNFELWYDNTNDERVKIVPGWYFYLGKKSSGNNRSSNITFIKPNDAKEDCKYIFVFRGQMGQENGAVAGRILY